MSAAEKIRLEGKDWFTEDEAAVYCGVSLSQFRDGCRGVGIHAKRFLGRKLYSRSDLYRAIADSPEWQPSTSAGSRGISHGPRVAGTIAPHSDPLRPGRRREYVPRRKPS